LDESVLQIKTKIVSCQTADSKPVKQEVNGTMILPPLVFPGLSVACLASRDQCLQGRTGALLGTNTLAYSTEASATIKTNLYNIDVGAKVTNNLDYLFLGNLV
jgi:hypothetical protein